MTTTPQENPFQTPATTFRDTATAASGEPLFRMSAVAIASFFGTPLAGAWVMAQNLKRLGRPREVQKAWLVAIGITLLVFAIAWFLPDNFPTAPINIVTTFAMHQYALQNTGDALSLHASTGGSYCSNWRAFGVSLLFLLAVMAVAFVAAFVLALGQNA